MFQPFIWNLSLFTTICSVRTPTVEIVAKTFGMTIQMKPILQFFDIVLIVSRIIFILQG